MIQKISSAVQSSSRIGQQQSYAPSFGLAKLSEIGRTSADSFGYQHNTFLNPELFKRQGIFQDSALRTRLKKGDNFLGICKEYGCGKNAKSNAEFIRTQILSSKAMSAFSLVEEDDLIEGLVALYDFNYDNPELSVKQTRALLELIKGSINADEYIKNIGLLQAGTKK